LKLISRIYDPAEGTIFIDKCDIKTLRLADLRAAMSVLFQDYTHFPLSVSLTLTHPRSKVPDGYTDKLAHDYDKVWAAQNTL
jgi:ABC-type multidrug transport system fused ATPase/permease subunit